MLNLSHKTLEVYKIATLMVKEVYRLSKLLPKEEQFTLTTQLRRASISVCSNLAEGAARTSSKEKKRFYKVARASVVEIDTQIEISLMLEYINKENIVDMEKYQESVFRMLSKMIQNLEIKPHLSNPTSH